MTEWRVANSLLQLRAQVNALHPNRSKQSDGTIGDAAHASRSSDHNPWLKDGGVGIVTGMDITHDPANGCDSYVLAEKLLASRDARIKYVISNGKIASGTGQGNAAWTWRKYTGSNKHAHHVHISVKDKKASYDDTSPWGLGVIVSAKPDTSYVAPLPTLRRGDISEIVGILQDRLIARGFKIKRDRAFGGLTELAVKAIQAKAGIHSDGIVGPITWEQLS